MQHCFIFRNSRDQAIEVSNIMFEQDVVCTRLLVWTFVAGTSQSSGASLFCDPCEKGMYQDETGKLSCKRCEVGSYQDQEGSPQCIQYLGATASGLRLLDLTLDKASQDGRWDQPERSCSNGA